MAIKNCTTCTWAEWQLHPSGKRKLESHAKCTVLVDDLPHSFSNYRGDMPERGHVTKYTKADCPKWYRIVKKQ